MQKNPKKWLQGKTKKYYIKNVWKFHYEHNDKQQQQQKKKNKLENQILLYLVCFELQFSAESQAILFMFDSN